MKRGFHREEGGNWGQIAGDLFLLIAGWNGRGAHPSRVADSAAPPRPLSGACVSHDGCTGWRLQGGNAAGRHASGEAGSGSVCGVGDVPFLQTLRTGFTGNDGCRATPFWRRAVQRKKSVPWLNGEPMCLPTLRVSLTATVLVSLTAALLVRSLEDTFTRRIRPCCGPAPRHGGAFGRPSRRPLRCRPGGAPAAAGCGQGHTPAAAPAAGGPGTGTAPSAGRSGGPRSREPAAGGGRGGPKKPCPGTVEKDGSGCERSRQNRVDSGGRGPLGPVMPTGFVLYIEKNLLIRRQKESKV